jgi:hypothetical protein
VGMLLLVMLLQRAGGVLLPSLPRSQLSSP